MEVRAVIRPEYHLSWVMGAGPAYLLLLKVEAVTRLLDQSVWAEKGRLLVRVMAARPAYLLQLKAKVATLRTGPWV